ncbi:aldo/keto reductase [Mycetohabitans endofungorum]|uniref:aldo/keto reductase n=2 Tax=Burkholderiales TaxID=80840 RepID=UPI00095FCF7A|nr:Aldo/keto reductase family protein [Burkholderia sp. b14]
MKLGNTGLAVSRLRMRTMTFGVQTDEDISLAILAYHLAKARGRTQLRNSARFVSVQPRYSLPHCEIERELLPLAAEDQLTALPYNPLAGGLLTGKHSREAGPGAGNCFALGNVAKLYQERY